MKINFIIYSLMFLINLYVASAQTGLFTDSGVTTFATTGVLIVVVVLLIKEFFKRLTGKSK